MVAVEELLPVVAVLLVDQEQQVVLVQHQHILMKDMVVEIKTLAVLLGVAHTAMGNLLLEAAAVVLALQVVMQEVVAVLLVVLVVVVLLYQ